MKAFPMPELFPKEPRMSEKAPIQPEYHADLVPWSKSRDVGKM
jgi:hypothetical protein